MKTISYLMIKEILSTMWTPSRSGGRLLRFVLGDAEVSSQFQSRFPGRKIKKAAGEADHIAIRLTSETVEPLIDFHAWVPVRMEGTPAHPISADANPVAFRCFSCG